jgi:DNA-3-methyladenine glycosylase I
MLILEGAQAGLSWITILRKRQNYRQAFDDFDADRIARYSRRKIESLLNNTGIVRNRLKIEAAVSNARAYCALRETGGSFADFVWRFVDGKPVINRWRTMQQIPASTPVSDELSKTLKKRGFKFVGSTICYAYMQAVGMVNDHLVSCPQHRHCRPA